MVSIGVTRWPTRTPGSTAMLHERGRCCFGHAANVARGVLERGAQFLRNLRASGAPLAPRSPTCFFGVSRIAIQSPRPGKQRRVAAAAHVGDDARGHALPRAASLRRRAARIFSASASVSAQDSHHSTILFSGYSTMPCACAAFSFGIRCRTTSSSTMVLMATQSGVGKRGDGRILQRRQRLQHGVQVLAPHVQHDAHLVVRGDGALQQQHEIGNLLAASRDRPPRRDWR